jgi:DNA repair photolyase
LVAPIIPGLTDSETPAILRAAREAGASSAGYILLRLPLTVRPVFDEWLWRNVPMKHQRRRPDAPVRRQQNVGDHPNLFFDVILVLRYMLLGDRSHEQAGGANKRR